MFQKTDRRLFPDNKWACMRTVLIFVKFPGFRIHFESLPRHSVLYTKAKIKDVTLALPPSA